MRPPCSEAQTRSSSSQATAREHQAGLKWVPHLPDTLQLCPTNKVPQEEGNLIIHHEILMAGPHLVAGKPIQPSQNHYLIQTPTRLSLGPLDQLCWPPQDLGRNEGMGRQAASLSGSVFPAEAAHRCLLDRCPAGIGAGARRSNPRASLGSEVGCASQRREKGLRQPGSPEPPHDLRSSRHCLGWGGQGGLRRPGFKSQLWEPQFPPRESTHESPACHSSPAGATLGLLVAVSPLGCDLWDPGPIW